MLPPMRMPMPAAPVFVFALAIALAGCSSGGADDRAGAAGTSTRATTSAGAGAPGSRGDAAVMPATPAELARVVHAGGAPVTLVNVWATWCNPCREEMPALLNVARRHPDVRLVLVSADFDDQRDTAMKFLADHGVTGTTYIKNGADQEFIDTFNRGWTGSLPATFVYDAKGRAVAFWEGAADESRFEAAISQARRSQP
jgi:thiol-disulfide isomerase/thioredoxin